jgi:hypothetical protein
MNFPAAIGGAIGLLNIETRNGTVQMALGKCAWCGAVITEGRLIRYRLVLGLDERAHWLELQAKGTTTVPPIIEAPADKLGIRFDSRRLAA